MLSQQKLYDLLTDLYAAEMGGSVEELRFGEDCNWRDDVIKARQYLMGELPYFSDDFAEVKRKSTGAGEKYQSETALFRHVPTDTYFTMSRTYTGSYFSDFQTDSVTSPTLAERKVFVVVEYDGVEVKRTQRSIDFDQFPESA